MSLVGFSQTCMKNASIWMSRPFFPPKQNINPKCSCFRCLECYSSCRQWRECAKATDFICIQMTRFHQWETSKSYLGTIVDCCLRLMWTDTSMCLHLLQPPSCIHANYHFNLMLCYLINGVCTFKRVKWQTCICSIHFVSHPCFSHCLRETYQCLFYYFILCLFCLLSHTDSNVPLSTLSQDQRTYQ